MLDIYRGGSIIATVNIDESTVYTAQINGEDKVKCSFVTTSFIEIRLGDHIFVNGKKYQINELIDFEIDHLFRYDIVFENAGQYDLLSAAFLKSSLFGTATEMVTEIVSAMNLKDSGWTVGDIDDNGVKITIDFLGDSCRSALTKVLDKFGLELQIIIKEINLKKKVETDSGLIEFEYGMGKGLYSMQRKTSGEFFTRAYGQGSTRNIPAGYASVDGRLTFDPGYVDRGVSEWGVFEKIIIFDEIYPQRTGSITSVGVDLFTLSDSTIDFNLSDNFIDGTAPKIVMQSGDLAGEEFEIIPTSYNHTTKTFQIKPSYEGAYSFPNSTIKINIGDTYVFVGINLPQSYVDDAEYRLELATTEYINNNGGTMELSFNLNIDEKYIRDNSLEGVLQLGTKVKVKNASAGIDADLRVTSISYPLIAPSKITCTVADKLPPNNVMELQKIVVNNATQNIINEKVTASLKNFTSIRLDEFQSMVFDPMGNYYTEKIRPLSIETAQLMVGTRSQIFALSVAIKASTSDMTSFSWLAGTLDHYTVIPDAITTWNIPAGSISSLSPTTAYYIYARCNKANTNGTIILDTTRKSVDEDSTYYYFLIGVLSSRILDRNSQYVRRAQLNYGTSEVNGAFITAGALISQDGLTQLNLDGGFFQGRLYFLDSSTSNYKDVNIVNAEALEALDKAGDAKGKVDLLKSWTYEETVLAAMKGETIITGGHINTVFLDADAVRATVIKTDYIEGLELNFVQGTIGGNEITNTGIVGDKFSITNGVITAIDAEFENITVDGLTAVNADITGEIKTSNGATASYMSASGLSIYNGAYGGVSFSNTGQNTITGAYLSLEVSTIVVNGSNGWTGTLGGRSVINGIVT